MVGAERMGDGKAGEVKDALDHVWWRLGGRCVTDTLTAQGRVWCWLRVLAASAGFGVVTVDMHRAR